MVEVLPFVDGNDAEEEFGGGDGDGAGVANLATGEETARKRLAWGRGIEWVGGGGGYDMKSSMWAFVSCLFSFLLRILRKEVRPGGAVDLGPISLTQFFLGFF